MHGQPRGAANSLPSSIQGRLHLAAAAALGGNLPEADRLLTALREDAPLPQVLLLATQVSHGLGHYREALANAAVLADSIAGHEDLLHAARWLRRLEMPEALERLAQRSEWRNLSDPELAELALHLGSGGIYDLAFECLDHLVARAPLHADAHYLIGLFRMFAGEKTESVRSLRRALSINPLMANTHWLLSMQETRETAKDHAAEIAGALRHVRTGSRAHAMLLYSLHHSLHMADRFEEAWQALRQAHVVMRRITPYRPREQHALFDALKGLDPVMLQPEEIVEPTVGLIFIVGMFRSGTTLIEKVLAGHPEVTDAGETLQFTAAMRVATDHDSGDVVDLTTIQRAPAADFGIARSRMESYARWRSRGRPWLTEKLPSNFLNIGFILRALPGAKILHMRRDPVETCFSNLRTVFQGAAPYACDQGDLADYYTRYRDLMAHWHRIAPGRILDVDYSAFVDDPEGQAQRIVEHCGLDYLPDILDISRQGGMVATASAASVRGEIQPREGAWKPYEAELQPLIRALRPS